MKKILATILILLGFYLIPQAQEVQFPKVLLPSPTSAGLGKYGDISPSLSSGAINISIPFYSAAGKNLTVPLSISYNSTGLKVDEVATRAGFGWVLNAGGCISRTVFGEPDL
jgi:hypothetical protein